MNYHVDKNGYYGPYGGAVVPEILKENIEVLTREYIRLTETEDFKKEFNGLLRDYVGRPSPLYFARNLSEKYNTKIYLKREDLNHTGAHKINNTIGQILLAKRLGKTRIIAETGAGQHGVATATVCALMNMECVVYMGQVDMERQALNVRKMEMLGAQVVAATSGAKTLKEAVDTALIDWCEHPEDTFYLIGSAVGPHPYPDMVARFQSVISEEIKKQLQEQEGRDYPDYLVACIGAGSNAAGTFFHYLPDERVKLIGVEAAGKGLDTPESAATVHLGKDGTLHASETIVMYTPEGEIMEPYSIAPGLDYPGIGPLHAHLARTGRSKMLAATDKEALEAAFELTAMEGIIPAIESSHALATLKKRAFGPEEVVVITVSGRGDKDMDTYIQEYGKRLR